MRGVFRTVRLGMLSMRLYEANCFLFLFLLAAARAIQDQLLKDFTAKSEFSDWFTRDIAPKAPIVLKPNPRNIEHEERIADLEAKIKRYVQPCSLAFFLIVFPLSLLFFSRPLFSSILFSLFFFFFFFFFLLIY
jgi:hypothetical protein